MKKEYVKPEVEIVNIETENILAGSSWGNETEIEMSFSDDEDYSGEFD